MIDTLTKIAIDMLEKSPIDEEEISADVAFVSGFVKGAVFLLEYIKAEFTKEEGE